MIRWSTILTAVLCSIIFGLALASEPPHEGKQGPPSLYKLSDAKIVLEVSGTESGLSYAAAIHGDGRVLFEGHANTPALGHREATVGVDVPEYILKLAYRFYFFDLGENYTDISTIAVDEKGVVHEQAEQKPFGGKTTMTIQIRSYVKRVSCNDYTGPQAFWTVMGEAYRHVAAHGWLPAKRVHVDGVAWPRRDESRDDN